MVDLNYATPEFDAGSFDIVSELTELEGRLQRGWEMIEAREAAGESTDRLMTHFLDLLGKYEAAYDRAHAA